MIHRKLQPSGDHVLIQYSAQTRARAGRAGKTTPGKKASAATVIAVGPGQEAADGSRIPLGLKVGEQIFVDRARGINIRLKQQSYAVIRKDDLVAALP